jgi:hypothetical protein
MSGDLAVRWRFRGMTPSPEQWLQRTWSGVLAQFVVVGRATGKPLGLVTCYQANFQDGHAYLAVVGFGDSARTPLVILAFALFVDYVFSMWNFCKVYMEVPEYNMPQFATGRGRFLDEEGRLRGHLYTSGERYDQVILAIHRQKWLEVRRSLIPRASS